MNVAESIVNAWTAFEHVRRIKRFKDEDLEWIKFSQNSLVDGLKLLIGEDKTNKRIANARIALREWQQKQKDTENEEEISSRRDASGEL